MVVTTASGAPGQFGSEITGLFSLGPSGAEKCAIGSVSRDNCGLDGSKDDKRAVFPAEFDSMRVLVGICQSLRMSDTSKPRWGNYRQAAKRSGLSIRLLQDYVSSQLVRSSVVLKPGASRGVRLIDLESLEAFIEAGVAKTVERGSPATEGQKCDEHSPD